MYDGDPNYLEGGAYPALLIYLVRRSSSKEVWVSASMLRRLQPGSNLYQSSWDQRRLSLIEASSLSNLSPRTG